MAIKKAIELDSGITADYWRIYSMNIKHNEKSADLLLYLYVDETYRPANKVVATRFYTVGSDALSGQGMLTTPPLESCYTALKLLEDFLDAEDV